MVFGELKSQLLTRKAQGAYFVADTALASGELDRAARLYRSTARELASADVEPRLQVQGWLGMIRCGEQQLAARRAPGRELAEAISALGQQRRAALPDAWSSYDAWRALMIDLLALDVGKAADLGRVLARWFPSDPRPHYALGRAWEAQVERAGGSDARLRITRKAIGAYQAAIAASGEQGCRPRWEPTLRVRIAGLMWRHVRPLDPEASAGAARQLADLDRGALADLAPPYRVTVAQIWLGQGRAMDRLRALDMLESAAGDPAFTPSVIRGVEGYLESLGWNYYATEQDRVRAIVERCASSLGPLGVRRALRYLDLLRELRQVAGSNEGATVEHLQRLLSLETEAHGDSVTAAYYWAALALLRQPDAPLAEALDRALGAAQTHLDALPSRLMREPVALALGALHQLRHPEPRRVRELLSAFAARVYQVPHVQSSFGLLLPTLLSHWHAWPDLQPAMRDGIARFIHVGLRPSYGFAAVGVALIGLGEPELAHTAAARALAEPDREPPALLTDLKLALAAGALEEGKAHEAVRWLLGA